MKLWPHLACHKADSRRLLVSFCSYEGKKYYKICSYLLQIIITFPQFFLRGVFPFASLRSKDTRVFSETLGNHWDKFVITGCINNIDLTI